MPAQRTDIKIESIIDLKKQGFSAKRIARTLGCCGPHVLKIAKEHGISFTALKNNSKIEQFKKLTDPKLAYFIGFLWADGFLIKRKRLNNTDLFHGVAIQIKREDGYHLYDMIKDKVTISIREYNRQYKDGHTRTPQLYMWISDSIFANWLISMGFDKKSGGTFSILWEHLPQHLRAAFLLGYFDGDGSIDYKKKIQFASTYEQDWSHLSNILTAIGAVSYIRYIKTRKGHKASMLILRGKKSSIKLIEYFYPYLHMMLPRKLLIANKVLEHEKMIAQRKEDVKRIMEYIRTHNQMTQTEIALNLGIPVWKAKAIRYRMRVNQSDIGK